MLLRPSLCVAGLLASLTLAAPASGAAPNLLLQIPADSVTPGSAAGQLNNPWGMAADPDTGHLFVAESSNPRISEFTPWGAFVKAWGWDVAPEGAPGDTVSNQFEVCTATCKAGVEGNGVGQFTELRGGIALDATGDLYVYENANNRVQKFSPSGQFLLMFGGEVNQGPTNPGNLCTAQHVTEGDTCGAGTSGTADGQFSNGTVGNYIAYNPTTDSLFVGDKDRIQEFDTDGTFKGKIDFEGELGKFDEKPVGSLAADPVSGDLYLALAPFFDGVKVIETPNVYRLDPATGELLDELEVDAPGALAVDIEGNLYAVEQQTNVIAPFASPDEVLGFGPSGAPIEGMEAGDEFAMHPHIGTASTTSNNGLATNVAGPGSEEPGNLYVDYFGGDAAYINAYGPPPIGFEDPPLAPPEISDQYATAADTDSALVKAKINPRFWPDTTYRVQYGTEECVEEAGWEAPCVQEEPATPALLTPKSTTAFITTPGVFLAGLAPDTAYRYRFLAESSGSVGEEVIGVGGKPGEPGTDASFTTFPLSDPPKTDCANQAFRTGPAAKLPDCRAYEMVSPLDKNNGDIRFDTASRTGLHQSSTAGDGFTYTSAAAFGDVAGAPNASQYLAFRDPATGWTSEVISPPRTRFLLGGSNAKFDNEFRFFSPDLCDAWLKTVYDPPLAAGGVAGFPNIYHRRNCSGGAYEALTTVEPPQATPGDYGEIELQGVSADGTRAVFTTQDKLTDEAPSQPAACGGGLSKCRRQLYLHTEGEPLRYLCVLPDGNPVNPATHACFAGTVSEKDPFGDGKGGSFQGALSADGQRVYWTAGEEGGGGGGGLKPGRIYLRLIEAEETLEVSETVSGADAFFWGAAADGSAAVFEFQDGSSSFNNDLYRYDAPDESSEPIAEDTVGVLGVSSDATRVYFASTRAIPGSGQNSEGDEAAPGEPNLYLYEASEPPTYSFIGTLSGTDVLGGGNPSPIAGLPFDRTSRVSANGLHAAFMSSASLTGYDNTDAVNGKADAEIFLYDAEADELACVSCNRSGIRPTGRVLRDLLGEPLQSGLQAAAQIPTFERALYPSRLLSEDGSRLFFESYEALVTRDTNGQQDVYQWEEAGTGDCEEADSTFNEEAGGCVDLVSSGESPNASFFRDASPSGDDVFFTTLSSFLPQDYGLIDIYDARVGGGFPQPSTTPECEGEACQGPISPPEDPTPASSAFEGAGNVAEPPPARKCAKGRRAVRKAGRTRCVKKPNRAKQKKVKRVNTKGRAGR